MTLSLETFQQHYIELVNDDDMHARYADFCKTGAVSPDDIKRFIIDTPNFAARLHAVLHKVVPAVSANIPVDQELTEQCIQHCKNALQFSIRDISEVVQTIAFQQIKPEQKIQPEVVEAQKPAHRSQRAFVMAYEKQMNRPMYAMELLVHGDYPSDEDSIAGLAMRMRKAYDDTCDIVLKYQGRHISEHDFVTNWLERIVPLENYADRIDMLRRSLLNSDTYKSVMKQRICSKYTTMFGAPPTEDDVNYFFRHIVCTEMHLLDDAMDEMLVDMYREKQADMDEITAVYEDTYNRCPDKSELEQALRDYRCETPRDDYSLANEKLRRVLCSDLEYHDVVKRKIIEAYNTEEDTLTTRSMYSVLKQVLRAVPQLHDTPMLDSVIDRVVRQMREQSDDMHPAPVQSCG